MDAALARRAVQASERNALGAFATTMTWMRVVALLIEGNLEAARQLIADEPPTWIMGSASCRVRCFAAEIALALGDVQQASTHLDEAESRLAPSFHYFTAAVQVLRAHVARARNEIREAATYAHRALEIATEHELQVVVVDALETLALLAADVHDEATAVTARGLAKP
jgi:ATP/maltotriose-dependent transcriptional regulator MalT